MSAVILTKGDAIKIGDSIVGEVTEDGVIELHLAWLRLVGAGLVVYGDKKDPRRVALNRPANAATEEQESDIL